ncbi:hypothetical protein [Nocardia harenae]|uniref:hypothetical protein n=1 Tax=Nocardia harenae TaxID=358707 RepID=UPI0012ED3997|nr:hypothetical protein [Nocardia harenae]
MIPGTCSVCGEKRELIGITPQGGRWCGRCKKRHVAAADLQRKRDRIIAAAVAVEPEIPMDVINAAVRTAAPLKRHASMLAAYLAEHPDALSNGPTSDIAPLHRLAGLLAEAGARRIAPRHPVCARCGRHERRHKRADGGTCANCRSQEKRPCPACGKVRRPYALDADGRTLCQMCIRGRRRQSEAAELTDRIADWVLARNPDTDRAAIIAVIDAVAPNLEYLRRVAAELGQEKRQPPGWPPGATANLIAALVSTGAAANVPALICHDCLQHAGPNPHISLNPVTISPGVVRCDACTRNCPACGRSSRLPGENICGRCRTDRARPRVRGTCAGCGTCDQRLGDAGTCRRCRSLVLKSCDDCGEPAHRTRSDDAWVCQRCALRRDVDKLLPDDGGPLAALREPILAAKPKTTRMWLAFPHVAERISALRDGQIALTHTALDQLPAGRDVEHLRHLLVGAGALPPDPLRRVNDWAAQLPQILVVLDQADSRTVRSWLNWKVLPRLRRRAEAGQHMGSSLGNARQDLREVVAFLSGLAATGRSLATCRQDDLDNWFGERTAQRYRIRPFLSWAKRRRHLPRTLSMPPKYRGTPTTPTDPESRWTTARRLVDDDSIHPADRIAAALVVLYAQPLARVTALTLDHIRKDGQAIMLRLGKDELELPEPFASLIVQLPCPLRDGPSMQFPGRWLFPGARPGRPMGPIPLANRLVALDIQPRPMRASALRQLSTELPPAIVASVLGLRPSTAVRWAGEAGGNWTNYVSDRQS